MGRESSRECWLRPSFVSLIISSIPMMRDMLASLSRALSTVFFSPEMTLTFAGIRRRVRPNPAAPATHTTPRTAAPITRTFRWPLWVLGALEVPGLLKASESAGVPQFMQKASPGDSGWPQLVQYRGSSGSDGESSSSPTTMVLSRSSSCSTLLPQLGQKSESSGISWPQFIQNIISPPEV